MLKKIIIAAAIAIASLGTNAEAASFTTTTEYTGNDTFAALKGCQIKALMQVPEWAKWGQITKYIEINYLNRNTCRLTCVVEYE